MHPVKQIEKELEKQMKEKGLTFGGEYLEDYYKQLEECAEYIFEGYEDVESIEKKVDFWIDDTRGIQPDLLQPISEKQITDSRKSGCSYEENKVLS